MLFIITILILICISYYLYKYVFLSSNINPHDKYILITGCGSGFGHLLAVELDKQGFNVFATVRDVRSVSSLKDSLSSRSLVFVLDITKQEDINQAYDIIKEKTASLHALINNAGFNRSTYIDWMSMEAIRDHMDGNYFGHVAMTKKFLPLLISKRYSRVINISSITGFISFGSSSAYSAAKYALEAFSDCLRREMKPWNLHVSIIEPGGMRTSFLDRVEIFLKNNWNHLSKDIQQRWGEDFSNELTKQLTDNPFVKNAENPMVVVRDIQHAVMNTHPQIRYRSGWQSKFMFILSFLFPDWLLDKLVLAGTSKLIPVGIHDQLKDNS